MVFLGSRLHRAVKDFKAHAGKSFYACFCFTNPLSSRVVFQFGRLLRAVFLFFRKAYHDDPKLMVKIWAIEEELANESVDLVIYLDADVTLHPDAPPLVSLLTGGERKAATPHKKKRFWPLTDWFKILKHGLV